MKTYSRADWEAALDAWSEGQFSREWREIRHVMAMQGCIFPPAGDRFDSWEDAQPSQRAVLIRAIREQPTLLRRCLFGAKTWSDVIEKLLRARDDWREEMAEREAELRAARLAEEPDYSHRQSVMSVGEIIRRLTDSVGGKP